MSESKISAVTVESYDKKVDLGEIYQSSGIQMALAVSNGDNAYKQVSPFVKCLDFLTDSFSATKQKHNFSIYGYSWNGETESPDFDAAKFIIKFPNQKSLNAFNNNIQILHKIEDKNNIFPTQYHLIDRLKVLVVGSDAWLANCLVIKLYLSLLRVCGYTYTNLENWLEELCAMSVTDGQYFNSVPRDNWNKLFNDLNLIKDTGRFCGLSFKKHGTSAVHHNSGIFVCLGGNPPEMNSSMAQKNKHYKILRERGFATA